MEIYVLVFVIEMLLGFLFLKMKPGKASNTRKILYLIVTTIILGTLCGLRSSSVGFDTEGYYISFTRTSENIGGILDNEQHIETGFAALCTIVKVLGGDFTHFLLFCSYFIVGSFCVFVYRHSSNVLLSIFILLCFPYYYSSFDIIRHFFATSFLLLGYKHILNGKLLKFALFILAGSLFHNSSIIYLLLYPLLRLKWSRKLYVLLALGGLIIMIYASVFANFIVEETGRFSIIAEQWVGQFSGGIITSVMYFAIFIIALLARKKQPVFYKGRDSSIIIVFMLFLFAIIFIQARIVIRYVMVFSGLLAVAMPYLLVPKETQGKKTQFILYVSFIIVGLAYHAFLLLTNWQNVVPYIPVLINPYL